MTKPMTPPRERAARALYSCTATLQIRATMWESYLDEDDTVISAVMGEEALHDIKDAE